MMSAMRASTANLRTRAVRPQRARAASNDNLAYDVFGDYIILDELGKGGMATVHLAQQVGGARKVALKRLSRQAARSRNLVDAFIAEARLASKLSHPNIARAFDHGMIDDTYFIAMELVAGPTLEQIIVQSRSAAGAIPMPITIEIAAQLCDALAHAHTYRVIHRDVSPVNVIVSAGGVVKLIDFGLAKSPLSRATTERGVIKGKLAYVAPEYTHGQLDHRVDLFAAGIIVHELLTGQRLFHAATDVDTIRNVRGAPITPPSRWNPAIPRELDDIVMTALHRDPAQRWQNAGAFAFALRALADEVGARVDGRMLHGWVEWAFTCERRR